MPEPCLLRQKVLGQASKEHWCWTRWSSILKRRGGRRQQPRFAFKASSNPPISGKLDIKLDVGADGKTGITITADNKGTLDLLQRDAQGLTKALNDLGLNADSGNLNFSLNHGQQDNGQPATQAALTYQSAQPEDDTDTTVNAITRSYVVQSGAGPGHYYLAYKSCEPRPAAAQGIE